MFVRKLRLLCALTLLPACEEINHVKVIAPREFVGAVVYVRGTEMSARLTHVRPDGAVETNEDLPLPPLEETLLVVRTGCETVAMPVPVKLGRTTVVIPPERVKCNGGSPGRATVRPLAGGRSNADCSGRGPLRSRVASALQLGVAGHAAEVAGTLGGMIKTLRSLLAPKTRDESAASALHKLSSGRRPAAPGR